jgi:hypothetical protein
VIVTDATDVFDNPANDDDDAVEISNEPTAVELLSFQAIPQVGAVSLIWETAVEIDHYGFYLLRSDGSSLDNAEQIAFVPAAGYGGGAVYRFKDMNVQSETLYTYWLVDVDTNGQRTVHAPVSAASLAAETMPYRVYLPLVSR